MLALQRCRNVTFYSVPPAGAALLAAPESGVDRPLNEGSRGAGMVFMSDREIAVWY